MSVVANVAINVDARNAIQRLRDVQSQSQATERAFGNLGRAVRDLAAGFSAIQAARFIFAKTAEIESQARSLQVLTGSAQKAGQIIKELQQLGAVTPFTSTELIDSAKRLQAFGVEADKVVETTRRLADVSGATGAELQGLVTAYGQVQAKGRLQGEELLQFQERGVALQEELRRMYGLSGDEFQKALEKGRIGAEAVEVAVIRLTSAGGKYADGAISQSDTLQGRLSTLQDGVDALAREIGTMLSPALKQALTDVINMVDGFVKGLQFMQNQYRSFLAGLRGQTTDQLQSQINQINQWIANNQNQLSRARGNAPVERILQNRLAELRKLRASLQKDLDEKLGLNAPTWQPATMQRQTAQPQTPALLGEDGKAKQKRTRQLSVDDLLGGQIQRRLRDQQANLEVATQRELNRAAAQPNAQQATRMVESASKLLGIKYQIDAIDKTITERDKVRAQIIASSSDKAMTAMAFDEQSADLRAKRIELEREIDKALLEQLGKAKAQYRQEQKAIEDALSGLDLELVKLQAKTEAEKQALQFLEIENQLKEKGVFLSEADANAIRRKIAEIQKLTKEQQAANNRAAELNELYDGVASQIAGGVGGAIDAVANGVSNLGDALKDIGKDILAAVGKMLIFYALAQAFGALGGNDGVGFFSILAKGFGFKGAKDGAYWSGGFQAFADGGLVTSPTMGLIGEGGEPEYVIPASKMRGAMNRYAAGARGSSVIPSSGDGGTTGATATMAPAAIDVRYTVERINSVDYVTADQFRAGMQQAAAQGAAQGQRQTLRRLQQSPSTRRRVGL